MEDVSDLSFKVIFLVLKVWIWEERLRRIFIGVFACYGLFSNRRRKWSKVYLLLFLAPCPKKCTLLLHPDLWYSTINWLFLHFYGTHPLPGGSSARCSPTWRKNLRGQVEQQVLLPEQSKWRRSQSCRLGRPSKNKSEWGRRGKREHAWVSQEANWNCLGACLQRIGGEPLWPWERVTPPNG